MNLSSNLHISKKTYINTISAYVSSHERNICANTMCHISLLKLIGGHTSAHIFNNNFPRKPVEIISRLTIMWISLNLEWSLIWRNCKIIMCVRWFMAEKINKQFVKCFPYALAPIIFQFFNLTFRRASRFMSSDCGLAYASWRMWWSAVEKVFLHLLKNKTSRGHNSFALAEHTVRCETLN